MANYFAAMASPKSEIQSSYSGALKRYADSTRQALSKFGEAESGYKALSDIYAPGGSYGAGQRAIVEKGASQALAQGQIGMVGTGMSSSTNATGMATNIRRGAAQQELGIEDTRSDRYAAVLKGLADLKASIGGQIGQLAANEPSYAPYAQTWANIYGTDVGSATSKYVADKSSWTSLQNANLAAQTQRDMATMKMSGGSGGGLDEDWL